MPLQRFLQFKTLICCQECHYRRNISPNSTTYQSDTISSTLARNISQKTKSEQSYTIYSTLLPTRASICAICYNERTTTHTMHTHIVLRIDMHIIDKKYNRIVGPYASAVPFASQQNCYKSHYMRTIFNKQYKYQSSTIYSTLQHAKFQ